MANFRYPGQRPRLRASEVNKWNQVAALVDQGILRPGRQRPLGYDPSSRVALVKNSSGADRSRFQTMAITGLVMDLATDGSVDVVFTAGAADPAEAPCVLIDEIASDEIGRAVIDGPALALVAGGTGDFAEANAPGHNLTPVSAGSIKLLKAPHATDETLVPVVLNVGSAGGSRIVQTPGGGIAASWGSASCAEYKLSAGSPVATGANLTVYNPWPFQLPASMYVVANQELGNAWVAVHPGVIDVRWISPNLEQSRNGTTYLNIDQAEAC